MRRVAVAILVLAGVLAPPVGQARARRSEGLGDRRPRQARHRARGAGARNDGRLRGEITMEKAWTTADLRAGARARRARSACSSTSTRVPGEDPPD